MFRRTDDLVDDITLRSGAGSTGRGAQLLGRMHIQELSPA